MSDKTLYYIDKESEVYIMAKEQNEVRLKELRSEAEELVKRYNDATQTGTGKYEEARKLDEAIQGKVNEYTSIVREMCFEECKAAPDPMLAAVTILSFVTIAVNDKKEGEDKIPIRSLIEKERPIDLLKLDQYCNGIGANKNWSHIAQKMNFLLTYQKAVDLGIDPKVVNDSYSMTSIAREFDMGKNPTSKTNLLKTLQAVVSAMLGDEYKATSHDVNFLLSVYARKNRKALTVSCANHKNFRNYIAEVCHRIVTGKSYGLDFKTTAEGKAFRSGKKKDLKKAQKAA